METTEGNKLIAEFMGAEISDPTRISFALDNKTVVNGMIRFHEDREPFLPRELRYHTSWDWLMGACRKWDLLNFKEPLLQSEYEILCDQLDDMVTTYKIDFAFKQLVYCINWYNQLTNK